MKSKNRLVLIYVAEEGGSSWENPSKSRDLIPLRDAQQNTDELEKQEKISGTSTKVAIVEDDGDLVNMYRYVVRGLGYLEVFVGTDGVDIVEAVIDRKMHPDVILMDYRMPRLNGLDAALQIRKVDPSVRIILATADDGVLQRAHDESFETIQKPFSLANLKKILRSEPQE